MNCARAWLSLLLFVSLVVPVLSAPVRFGAVLTAQDIASTTTLAGKLDLMKATGLGRVRIAADWPRLQPNARTWNFGWLDTVVDEAKARGLDIVLVFGPSPGWAVSYLKNPDTAQARRAKPDLPAFRAYVVAVTKRYQDRVQYYQVWERPNCATLLAMPKDVFALYLAATQAVHAVSSALRVVAPEPGDIELGWIADYLKCAHGAERADILSLSPSRAVLAPQALWWRLNVLRTRVLPAQGAPALWIEVPGSNSEVTGRLTLTAAALMQDINDITLVTGIGCNNPLGCQPLATGFKVLASLQGTQYAGWAQLTPEVYGGVFRHDMGATLLALPLSAQSITLEPASEPVKDGLAVPGNTVKVYDVAAPPQLLTIEKRTPLLLAPLPTLLTGVIVSIQPGSPLIQPAAVTGDMVTLSMTGNDLTAIRPVYDLPGGHFSMRTLHDQSVLCTSGDTNPWLHFDIPDGFLYYNIERTPVVVTVTVCGVAKPKKTGFNFYYDALSGMTYTPWQWIDVGPDKLFTYTIRLNDAGFSNREGYDLRLNKAGSEEDIRVVAMTVRKIAKPGR